MHFLMVYVMVAQRSYLFKLGVLLQEFTEQVSLCASFSEDRSNEGNHLMKQSHSVFIYVYGHFGAKRWTLGNLFHLTQRNLARYT